MERHYPEVAQRIQSVVRRSDRVFCESKNAFVIVLPNTEQTSAANLANRLLGFISKQPFT